MLTVEFNTNKEHNMTTATLPIDAYVVSLDETQHYAIAEEHKPHIEQIRGVYLFNRNERTYCCEMTPSHYLIHLYDVVVLSAAGEALEESARDRLHDEYENCGGEPIYLHCHSVKTEGAHCYHGGATGVSFEDANYDDQMEALREHYCANNPL